VDIAAAIDKSHEAYERQMRIFTAKSHDYSGNRDTLANSKAMATAVKALNLDRIITTPAGIYLFQGLWKIQRLANLLGGDGEPRCEAVEDSFDDLTNYIRLAALANEDSK